MHCRFVPSYAVSDRTRHHDDIDAISILPKKRRGKYFRCRSHTKELPRGDIVTEFPTGQVLSVL